MSKQKRKGFQLEKRVVSQAQAAGVSATRQPGSGVYSEYPSDGVLDGNILIECKAGYTEESADGVRSFRVQTEWIDKVEAHAARKNFRGGYLVFRPDGTNKIYALMSQKFLLQMIRERRELIAEVAKLQEYLGIKEQS